MWCCGFFFFFFSKKRRKECLKRKNGKEMKNTWSMTSHRFAMRPHEELTTLVRLSHDCARKWEYKFLIVSPAGGNASLMDSI